MTIALIMVWKFWLASFHFNSQITCHDSWINILLKKQLFCYERVKFIQQPVVTIQTFKVMEGSGREFGTFSLQNGLYNNFKISILYYQKWHQCQYNKDIVTNVCYLFIFSFFFHPLSSQIFCLSFPSFSSSCYKDPTACEPLFLATMIATVENIIKQKINYSSTNIISPLTGTQFLVFHVVINGDIVFGFPCC